MPAGKGFARRELILLFEYAPTAHDNGLLKVLYSVPATFTRHYCKILVMSPQVPASDCFVNIIPKWAQRKLMPKGNPQLVLRKDLR